MQTVCKELAQTNTVCTQSKHEMRVKSKEGAKLYPLKTAESSETQRRGNLPDLKKETKAAEELK